MKQKKALALILGVKIFLLGLVWFTATIHPALFNQEGYFENYHPPQESPSLNTWFKTWDGMHYIYIAEHGYQADHPLAAFYPLWPFLIRIGSFLLGGHSLIAALLLSNLLSVLGLLLFHKWLSQKDPQLADTALLLMLAYPGSIFFMFPYAESLFLFLSIAFFTLLSKRRYAAAACVSFLLPLTRTVGIFSVIPLASELAQTKIGPKPAITRKGWLLLVAPLALLSYLLIFYGMTGDALAGVKAQKYYIGGRSGANLFDAARFLSEYLSVRSFHDFTHSFVDRFWFTVFLASLPAIWKYSRSLFYYAFALGFFPVMTGSFMSFTRFLSVIFPSFIVWAGVFVPNNKRRRFLPLALILLFGFQIYFLIRHVTQNWAG